MLVILVALGLLYWWSHHRALARTAVAKAQQERCPHPPEAQRTLRVNNIMTMNPYMVHAVLPGRRWLVKQCDRCGKQTNRYRPLQPYDEYVAEFDQETVDRAAELQARTQAHVNDRANAERIRQLKREREMKK